jgi:hypothetical protein
VVQLVLLEHKEYKVLLELDTGATGLSGATGQKVNGATGSAGAKNTRLLG